MSTSPRRAGVLALGAVTALLAGALPVQAEPFAYTPSPQAVTGTINDVTIALDVVARNDQAGSRLELALLQKLPDGQWDYLGNQPINGIVPDPNLRGQGLMWAIDVSTVSVYRSPKMTAPFSGSAVQIMDKFGATMISDWIEKANAQLKAVFGVSRHASAKGPPFADWQQGARYLQGALGSYQLSNGRVVHK